VTPICFVDIESDGVHPTRRPWEIAVIRRDDGGETEWSAFVEIDLSTADLFGLRIGRFYDRHPLGQALSGSEPWFDAHGMRQLEAARIVARMTHGAHLFGAVPSFDTETLDPLLRANGLVPAWHYHLADVETLAVGFLAGQGRVMRPPWDSDDLTRAIGVEPASEDERHTALGDARWAMRIHDKIMEQA